ncbi:hypothetical protein ACJRO7_027264 [Eucalyptus globulus]|uniref:Uncharacterized protein n=1 Tax=Eucalyptus globulus TaxID=34317 RepID=A0ABD3JXS4_EUCGL
MQRKPIPQETPKKAAENQPKNVHRKLELHPRQPWACESCRADQSLSRQTKTAYAGSGQDDFFIKKTTGTQEKSNPKSKWIGRDFRKAWGLLPWSLSGS